MNVRKTYNHLKGKRVYSILFKTKLEAEKQFFNFRINYESKKCCKIIYNMLLNCKAKNEVALTNSSGSSSSN